MPPALARRAVLGPLWLVLAIVAVVLSPLLVVLGALGCLLTRNRQPLRLVHFGLVYLTRNAVVIVACAGLWVASGMGWRLGSEPFQARHYRLLGWLLDGSLRPILRSLNIEVDADPTDAARAALTDRRRPLLLFSRHAGPGDSFLIIDLLMRVFGRRPRIVMKRTIALDPGLDLLCHRLPNALLDTSDREACERAIAALSGGLGGNDVLVLFPEGGNYTPERRRRAIASLWRRGRDSHARRAQAMTHVMAPQPAGALAALGANPGADVIFAAHTGLGHAAFALELWRRPPVDATVHMRMWLAPAAERPSDPDAQTDWLFAWWRRLDDWIAERGTEAA